MKIKLSSVKGFTSIEFVAIAGAAMALSGLLLLSARTSKCGQSSSCLSNLKQVAIGFRLYANDHNGQYPFASNGVHQAWEYFNATGSEINNPKILLCPSDVGRPRDPDGPPDDFAATEYSFQDPKYQNRALSYFYGVDAVEIEPSRFLAGDRNIRGGAIIGPALLSFTTVHKPFWDDSIHSATGHVVFADGSARRLTTSTLREVIKDTGTLTNRFAMPE
jgi:hypothetical protein